MSTGQNNKTEIHRYIIYKLEDHVTSRCDVLLTDWSILADCLYSLATHETPFQLFWSPR